jgi:hypothetical protein
VAIDDVSGKADGRTGIAAVASAAAILVACVALWVALRLRVTGTDQSYLMIVAQEVLFGHHREFMDFPSSVIIQAPALLAFRWFGWPIVFSWNVFLAIFCAISASVFALRVGTKHPSILWCLWFGLSLMLFDDTLIGQREYLFSIFWFPYLVARLNKPASMWLDPLCGALLSIAICAKIYFVAFVLLIDMPILLLRRRQQSYPAFWAMTLGGVIQASAFFAWFGSDLNQIKARLSGYYGTVGVDYALVWKFLLGIPAVYIAIGAIALILALRVASRRPIAYPLACAASGGICLALSVLQGHPRPYTLIPLFLAAVACSLEAVFSQAATSLGGPQRWSVLGGQAVALACGLITAAAVLVGDNGLVHAIATRHFSAQPDYARIGPVPEDEYMSWVKKQVAPNEDVDVIALQYGGTSAFDPVLSTIRLGRRVNSANPILQFPLRAALVSGDRARIDAAWDELIKEIDKGAAAWVVIRRTTPAPMAPDFVKIIEGEPRFYSWLTSHYRLYEEFGPYVAYQRIRRDGTFR